MATLISAGVGLIFYRELSFESFFPDLPPSGPFTKYVTISLAIYFELVLVVAIRSAKRKNFRDHQRYIIRHVASGIWIALQRLILFLVFNQPPFTRERQRDAFGLAARYGIDISLILGEVAIGCLERQHAKKN